MNELLIYFAFPIATIIISAILQKILKNPISVAAFAFAVFLIVTFAVYDESFLIATLIYTILAFITAILTKIAMCLCNQNNSNPCDVLENIISNENTNNDDNSSSNCGCGCSSRFRRYRY